MNLIKWDPFRELEEVSERLNRLFSGTPSRLPYNREMLAVADWEPSADVSETDTAYLIKADIPGVNKEDVKVFIQNGMLTMQGERKMEKEEKGKKFHRIERSYGQFTRSYRIPDDADENSVKAEFKDGTLNITLAKSSDKKSKSRAIDIKVT